MSKIFLICYYPLTEMSALRGQTSKAINKRKACVKISLKKLVFSEIHIYFFVVSARFRKILHPLCFVVHWFYSLNKAQNLSVFYFTSVELFQVVLLYFTQFHFIFTCSHFTPFKFDCVAVYWIRIQRHQTMGWRPEPKSLSVKTSSKFLTVTWKWKITNKKTLERKKICSQRQNSNIGKW